MTVREPRTVRSLAVRRVSAADWLAADDGDQRPLGGLAYGEAEGAADDAEPAPLGVNGDAVRAPLRVNNAVLAPLRAGAFIVRAPVLAGAPDRIDLWSGNGATVEGRTGAVRWRHDGEWLFASVELAQSAQYPDMESVARQAYRDIFAALASTGFPHLLRVWNYLPGINADGGGLERYRQFNIGRAAAFVEAGAALLEGSPAACALGVADGPLCVHFLAGKAGALPIENPRQVSAYRYPTTYGPRSPTFSRAAVVQAGADEVALLISGTASIVGHESVHPGDVQAQTRETIANLRAVVAAANERCGAHFDLAALDCVVYVRHADDLPRVRSAFEGEVGADSAAARTAVYLRGDVCRADLLVEIEAHGFAAGEVVLR